jgi:hypothetical protein
VTPSAKRGGADSAGDLNSSIFAFGSDTYGENTIGGPKSFGKKKTQAGLDSKNQNGKKLGTFTGPDGNTRTIYPDDTGSKNTPMPMAGAPGTGNVQGSGVPRPSLFETRMQNQMAWITNQLSTGGGQNLDWRTPMGRQNIARRNNLRDVQKNLADLLNGQAGARTPPSGLTFGQRAQLKNMDLNNTLATEDFRHKNTLERDEKLEAGRENRLRLSSSAKQAITMAQERSRAIRARLAAGESIPPEELTMALMQIDNIGTELDSLFERNSDNGRVGSGSNALDPRNY